MSVAIQPPTAHANVREAGDGWVVELSGVWAVTAPWPDWETVRGGRGPRRVRVDVAGVDTWDSVMLIFLVEVRRWCEAQGVQWEEEALPAGVRSLVAQLAVVKMDKPVSPRAPGLVTAVGLNTTQRFHGTRDVAHFIGECAYGVAALAKKPRTFRWRDFVGEVQLCGALALPIVGVVNFLIGVTLAYTGAIVLRQYGGDIYVADLVGLSMVREMGPVMTAIVIAGRTGAAFAAQLATMKGNEEIDALETLGLRPVEFLVLPRVFALGLMLPLLAFYGNFFGIVGGMVIAKGLLDIPPTAYWIEMLTIVDLSDVMTGIIKSVTFGLIVGLSGCLRGMQADRDAAGVGRAATSAVVTSIILIIVADAVCAVVFNIFNW